VVEEKGGGAFEVEALVDVGFADSADAASEMGEVGAGVVCGAVELGGVGEAEVEGDDWEGQGLELRWVGVDKESRDGDKKEMGLKDEREGEESPKVQERK
jgi:hypothetical protein